MFNEVIKPSFVKIYKDPNIYNEKEKNNKIEEVIGNINKNLNDNKNYYLFSALGDFFKRNQPTGGFILKGEKDKPYMNETRYDLFSKKVIGENNVLVLSEAFKNEQTGSIIEKPDTSPFLKEDKYKTVQIKKDIHGVLVSANMENPTIGEATEYNQDYDGDFSLINVNGIRVLNWHCISAGIPYNDFKKLLDKVVEQDNIDLMMGDSNITEEKQEKLKKLKKKMMIIHRIIMIIIQKV